MSNDLIPKETGSWWSDFLKEFNLPKVIAGPAGEAISRLIAGAADIPAAYLQQVAQGVRDKTEAKTVVSKAIAETAANIAKNDPEIVKRAAHSLLSKELRNQSNKEAIAKKTLEILQEEHPKEATTEPKSVEADWMNVFEKFAGDASSERMQEMWARVLAGEIRKPGAFSLQTLRFIAELNQETARLFEKFATAVINADFIPFPPRRGAEFTELLRLQEFGLVTGVSGSLNKAFSISAPMQLLTYRRHALIVVLEPPAEFNISSVLLTNVGREIYNILKIDDDIERAKEFANEFPKVKVTRILYMKTDNTDGAGPQIELWKKEEPPATN